MYEIKRLWLDKSPEQQQAWQSLLEKNQLFYDGDVSYTVGMYDKDKLIGTASVIDNIIKYVAVSEAYQGQNLLSQLVNHMIDYLAEQQVRNIFLYTKPESKVLFKGIGFQTIVQTSQVVFMEFGIPTMIDYERYLTEHRLNHQAACGLVLNANPFTLGHQWLVEKASQENDGVYVFVVQENKSEFSFDTRYELVKKGVAHLPNVVVLSTDHYQVSSATFPSYFLKNQAKQDVAKVQATLDAHVFKERIAPWLGINKRYVGTEPFSKVTNLYNQAMKEVFHQEIELIEVPRIEKKGIIVSATKVRELINKKDWAQVKQLVPETTYDYLINMR